MLLSASKLTPSKRKGSTKPKKGKHSVSVIQLSRGVEESKVKGSSTVTKRKQSAADYGEKIREKTEDFCILGHCLEEYVREQRRNNDKVDLGELIKLIAAFNRSEIGKFSRPLEQLIGEIIRTIQVALPAIPVQGECSHQSPKKVHQEAAEDVIGTVKKGMESREMAQNKSQMAGDVKRLEENLGKLKYESNRLRYFLEEIAAKSNSNNHRNKRKAEEKR